MSAMCAVEIPSRNFANTYLDIAYIMIEANNYGHITKMKIAMKLIFLHVLLVGAFRFPLVNQLKPHQKPNSNIEPFLARKDQTKAYITTKMTKRSPVRVNRKTPKSQNQNLHPRRRKQLNAITAYFS